MQAIDKYLPAAGKVSDWEFADQHPSAVLLFEVDIDRAKKRAVLRSGTGVGKIPTLLVIDDDATNLQLIEQAFQKEFRVLGANNGPEGIEVALRAHPDVVVCEQRLTGTTGTQLLTRIAQLVPEAIRVLVTARSDYEILVEAINVAKVHHYIEKPVVPGELKSTVDSLLRARGPIRVPGSRRPRPATRELRPRLEYRIAELLKPEDSLWTDQPICLGRSQRNDIEVADPSVSNRHAHLSPVDNLIWISDLDSSNGTSVNGIRLTPHRPVRLNCGDEICFGRVFVRFHLPHGFYDFLNRLLGGG